LLKTVFPQIWLPQATNSLTIHLLEIFIKYVLVICCRKTCSKFILTKLITIDGDVNMETNPYITVTGTVNQFNAEDRSFVMTPKQYVVLTHSYSVLPVHAHFGDWHSNKRWGADGPKVTVRTTITFGGFFQRVVRERTLDRTLEFIEVEVASIAYHGTCSNLTTNNPTGISPPST